MAKEIERKFLVLSNDWRAYAGQGSVYKQAYICVADNRNLRVRIIDGVSAKITLKIGKSALVRDEFEYEIPVPDALDMVGLRLGTLIEKTRYRLNHHGFVFEVDVFEGDLDGLVLAEVEMASESDRPDLPAWLGPEVTGNPSYSNQSLAMYGLPKEDPHGDPPAA